MNKLDYASIYLHNQTDMCSPLLVLWQEKVIQEQNNMLAKKVTDISFNYYFYNFIYFGATNFTWFDHCNLMLLDPYDRFLVLLYTTYIRRKVKVHILLYTINYVAKRYILFSFLFYLLHILFANCRGIKLGWA